MQIQPKNRSRPLRLSAAGWAFSHAGAFTLYLSPIHAERNRFKRLIENDELVARFPKGQTDTAGNVSLPLREALLHKSAETVVSPRVLGRLGP